MCLLDINPREVIQMIDLLQVHPCTDHLPNGTEVHLVLPIEQTGGRPLYTTFSGSTYSRVRRKDRRTGEYRWEFRFIAPIPTNAAVNKKNGRRKQNYFKLRNHGRIYLHHAVCLAWNGPRKVDKHGRGYECHHLNGITTDNRACNLVWVSCKEHKKYDARQKALRELLGDLQIYSREDFERWHAMPEKEFQAMINKYHHDPNFDQMEWDMTHHCEC